jgi:DNA-binding NarL/FixJ family response regulator
VSFRRTRRFRVLLGNLGPMLRAGVTRELAGEVELIGDGGSPEAIVADAQRLRPDAVVLDLSRSGSRELGEELRALAPEAKVILLAHDESRMEVLDPERAEPRRIDTAVSDALLSELRPRQATAERT